MSDEDWTVGKLRDNGVWGSLLTQDPLPGFTNASSKLRGWQVPVVQLVVQYAQTSPHAGGTVVAPCGGGKTIIGIAISQTLKWPTLVLCNAQIVADQWVNESKRRGPTMLTANVLDSNGVRLLFKWLLQRDKGPVLIIVDEVHRLPAKQRTIQFDNLVRDVTARNGNRPFCLGLTGSYFRRSNENDTEQNAGDEMASIESVENLLSGEATTEFRIPLCVIPVPVLQLSGNVRKVNFYDHHILNSACGLGKLNSGVLGLVVRLVNSAVSRGRNVLVYCGAQHCNVSFMGESKNFEIMDVYAAALGCHEPSKSGQVTGRRLVARATTPSGIRSKIVNHLRKIQMKAEGEGTLLLLSNILDTGVDLPLVNVLIEMAIHQICPVDSIQRVGRIQRFDGSSIGESHMVYTTEELNKVTDRKKYLTNPLVAYPHDSFQENRWTTELLETYGVASKQFEKNFLKLLIKCQGERMRGMKLKSLETNASLSG